MKIGRVVLWFCMAWGLSYGQTHLFVASVSMDYAIIFGREYRQAQTAYRQQYLAWARYFSNQEELVVLSAVVFPELIRYQQLQDLIETEALAILYVQQGSRACDFSVGQFQIKPSFLEKIEQHYAKKQGFEYLQYQSQTPSGIRKERLQRLQTLRWQFAYLHCFYMLMEEKTNVMQLTKEQKIGLYATAYNAGFEYSVVDLVKKQHEAYFPYGKHFIGKQYCYADISVAFFKHDLRD